MTGCRSATKGCVSLECRATPSPDRDTVAFITGGSAGIIGGRDPARQQAHARNYDADQVLSWIGAGPKTAKGGGRLTAAAGS